VVDLDQGVRRTDGTRETLMRAAMREFALRPFSVVSLDDIVARAGLTKGAMYFRFESKRALAAAIIDDQLGVVRAEIIERHGDRLSGLESLIESSYFVASRDTRSDGTRAALNLLEQIGRSDDLHARIYNLWTPMLTAMITRGIADGDIVASTRPEALGRLLMSIYMGVRQTSNLDAAEEFFADLEYAWTVALPGFAHADRLRYLSQFVERCTTVAKY
jgi:AcrR family transcriptional regulator